MEWIGVHGHRSVPETPEARYKSESVMNFISAFFHNNFDHGK
jgi:hypothetical protein